MTGNKMSPTQLTLLTALNMLGSGIIILNFQNRMTLVQDPTGF